MFRKLEELFLCIVICSLLTAAAWADGAVYAMTNALDNNQVLVYHRNSDGSLSSTPVQTIATGGGGSGLQLAGVDALGSAGSVQIDSEHHLLFVVNTETVAENNGAGAYNTDCAQGTITSFVIGKDGTLTWADRVFSRGLFPNSLTVKRTEGREDLVYVLNAGGGETAICHNVPDTANVPNITGFIADRNGRMRPVGSTQPIDPGPASANGGQSCSDASAAGFSQLTGAPSADFQCGLNPPSFARSPAQVKFTPDGDQLVVTVKGTNSIYVFRVNEAGAAHHPEVTQAAAPELPSYFAFTFTDKGDMLVTELFGSATSIPKGGAGAVSTFSLMRDGDLTAISTHVNDGGTAACWIALEPISERYAYVANNLSASISSYAVGHGGTVSLLNGIAANGSGPNDLVTVQDRSGSFLYVVDAGTGTVGAFRINLADGSLTAVTGGSGLPAGRGAQGLAAY